MSELRTIRHTNVWRNWTLEYVERGQRQWHLNAPFSNLELHKMSAFHGSCLQTYISFWWMSHNTRLLKPFILNAAQSNYLLTRAKCHLTEFKTFESLKFGFVNLKLLKNKSVKFNKGLLLFRSKYFRWKWAISHSEARSAMFQNYWKYHQNNVLKNLSEWTHFLRVNVHHLHRMLLHWKNRCKFGH